MANEIQNIESDMITLLKAITPLQAANGGTVRGVSNIKSYLNVNTLVPPSAVVVFDGEKAQTDDLVIGGSLQETRMFWSVLLATASFAPDGEGRLGAAGAYQLINDVVEALEGQLVNLTAQKVKLFYLGSQRFSVQPNLVIYETRWRHNFYRQGA